MFSPWDIADKLLSAAASFDFPALLQHSIQVECVYDGEGTENDEGEDVPRFEAVHADSRATAPSAASTSRPSHVIASKASPTPNSQPSPPPYPQTPTAGHHQLDLPATTAKTTKRKSPSQIAYQKERDKKRQKSKKLSAQDNTLHKMDCPKLARRHVSDASSIMVPHFRLSDKTAAKTAYVGLRDPSASTKYYSLEQLVGDNSKEGFTLVEWDGT